MSNVIRPKLVVNNTLTKAELDAFARAFGAQPVISKGCWSDKIARWGVCAVLVSNLLMVLAPKMMGSLEGGMNARASTAVSEFAQPTARANR